MKKAELAFIPSPGLSHLISTVEMAKFLLRRDDRLSITVLIMKLPNDAAVATYTQRITTTTTSNLRLLHLPGLDDQHAPPRRRGIPLDFIANQTPHVRDTISNLIAGTDSRLAGLVLDIFCTRFVDIGRKFGLPSYVYCTSSVAGLGLARHLVETRFKHNQTLTQYRDSDVELDVPAFKNRVPARVLPADMTGGGPAADDFLRCFEWLPEVKGIMANTFYELESYAIDAMNSDFRSKNPRVYPVGPILNESSQLFEDDDGEVKKWLDDQDENSVVFLCFGTMGRLDGAQVREMALALEKSGCKFLWSLRNLEEVELPEGFLERTKGAGKVIKWAAQVAVLAHAAVGGFVSHCGWNSTLESVWFGVPIATLPLYAEQQMNAFQLVKELGMAEMIRLDYKMGFGGAAPPPEIVGAEEIEAAIRRLMAAEGVRGKVKEMQKMAREALERGDELKLERIAQPKRGKYAQEELARILQEMQRNLIDLHNKEQKKEALKLLDLEGVHSLFDELILRASECLTSYASSKNSMSKNSPPRRSPPII